MAMKYLDLAGLEHLWSQILSKLADKVDVEPGKQLSTNDFTDIYKTRVDNALTGGDITYTASQTSGTKLGNITVDGTAYTIYAPADKDTHYSATFGTSASPSTAYFDSTNITDPYLKLIENSAVKGAVQLVGGDNVTITRGTDGKITIDVDKTSQAIQMGNIMAQESSAGGWAFVVV